MVINLDIELNHISGRHVTLFNA